MITRGREEPSDRTTGARYGREDVVGLVNVQTPVECLRGAFGRRQSRPRLAGVLRVPHIFLHLFDDLQIYVRLPPP